MPRSKNLILLFMLFVLLLLPACGKVDETKDWKSFQISEEPALNIKFSLPPNWLIDYGPSRDKPGMWSTVLVPPKCSADQTEEFKQNCVNFTAHVKGVSTFEREAFFDLTSGDILLSQDGTKTAKIMGKDSFKVHGLKVERFDHLIRTSLGDVKMSTYFLETNSAYFVFVTSLPSEEAENSEVAQYFDLMLKSIRKTK